MYFKFSYKVFFQLFVIVLFLTTCKKIENYEANNIEFQETIFEIEESITLEISNDVLGFANFTNPITGNPINLLDLGNCADLVVPGLNITIPPVNFDEFLPTENPNPLAPLTYDIKTKSITLELVNTECDFTMLDDYLTLYFVLDSINSYSDFIIQNPTDPHAPHNAVKIGECLNLPNSSTLEMTINEDAILDQFIHSGTFQTYFSTKFDKLFTEDIALIKTTMLLEVKLKNDR